MNGIMFISSLTPLIYCNSTLVSLVVCFRCIVLVIRVLFCIQYVMERRNPHLKTCRSGCP